MAEPSLSVTRFIFLSTDLDLANTFVQLAETELEMLNREHCHALLDKAQKAVDTARRLMHGPPQMEPDQRRTLTNRCDELESAIAALRRRTQSRGII